MPQTLRFDTRGRITIPADLRKHLTDEVAAILTPHGVVLHPIPAKVPPDALPPASGASGERAGLAEAG